MRFLSSLYWAVLIAVLEVGFPPALLFRPATGACTAALLIRGRRAWPIAFAAILAAGEFLGYSHSQALLQAACDSLQALLARHLVLLQLGFPNPLSDTRQLVRFHLLVGPVAGLVGSLLKLVGFLGLGLPTGYPPLAFFLMDWLGQMLGSTLTTAPLLSLSAPDPTWKRRRASVVVPTLFLIVVSLYGRRQVQKQVDRLEQVDLHREAQTLAQDLQSRFDECCTMLYGLAAVPAPLPALAELRLPEKLPAPKLLVSRQLDGSWQHSGSPAQLEEVMELLEQHDPKAPPSAWATSAGAFLVVVPTVPPRLLVAGLFDRESILDSALAPSGRDPGTRFRVLLGERVLSLTEPVRPLRPPLIHDQADLSSGFRVQVSRRFDTNRPRVGLPIAFTIYSALLFYLLRMSNQAERLERALLAARQAEQAKNLFLGNMSHEIRTPMNGVLGLTRLVLQSGLAPPQAEQLRHAERSGQALLGLLNELLEVSKMEAGEVPLHPAPIGLEALLEQVVRSHSLTAQAKGLELLVAFEPGVPGQITIDESRLAQILNNLLGNAIKFTLAGEIELKVLLTQWKGQEACLRFSVRDTGPGIPSDRLESIFAPFVQANTTFSAKNSGAGLGLAIASQLVERMGGKLEVSSSLGGGSTFGFELKCPAFSAPSEPFVDFPEPALTKCWVQVSHPAVSYALKGQLSQWGFSLACSAAEAQLLLLDEQSLEEWKGGEIPAVVLWPLARLGLHFQKCRKERVVPLLRPVFPGALREALGQALNPLRPAALSSASAGEPTRDYWGKRALVADDHATNRFLAQLLLERLGFSVDCVEDGEKAVDTCLSGSYDLVLMDLRMPRLDGWSASRAIRANGVRTVILGSTAHSQAELDQQPAEGDLDGVLHKPISESALRQAVSDLLVSSDELRVLRESLLNAVGGDQRSARAVAKTFLEEVSAPIDLHRLKGSVEIFGDSALLRLCREHEAVSPDSLKKALARLKLVLRAFLEEGEG